jgi:hypothetical protein
MASSINASTAGAGGVITTADNSGVLQVQTAGTTALTIDSSQNISGKNFTPTSSTVPTNGIYLPSANNLGIATNTALAMNINANGVITTPKNPKFSANLSGSVQSCASGATILPTFGSVNFDLASNYNSSTSTFTAPVAGFYQFNVRLRIDGITGSSNYANVELITPSKTFNTIFSAFATYTQFQIAVIAYMGVSDTAYVRVGSNGQTISLVNNQPAYADFSGFLVG